MRICCCGLLFVFSLFIIRLVNVIFFFLYAYVISFIIIIIIFFLLTHLPNSLGDGINQPARVCF